MDISLICEELLKMNLYLYEDTKYPARTSSKKDLGFLWLLECEQRHDATYLRIGRDGTINVNQDGEGIFYICICGPNFGLFFEHFFRIGTLRNIEIPQIAFPKDHCHDDFRPVHIQCKVSKKSDVRRHINAESQKVSTQCGVWDFPRFLFEKETWSTSFIIMLSSELATFEYEVIWNESGIIYFQTKQVVYKKVHFWGKFDFEEKKYDFQLTFQPGELKKQVCKIEPIFKTVEDFCTLSYKVFLAIGTN